MVKTEGVSRETQLMLEEFAQFFEKWATKINLVAPSTLGNIWERHILDSLQIYELSPDSTRWMDIGSGGGFPGLITAIMLRDVPGAEIHLVESNNKKCGFLRAATVEFGLPATIHAARIDGVYDQIGSVDCISARALADLDNLCDMVLPWYSGDQTPVCYFHKGRDYQYEIDIARGRFLFDLIEHKSPVAPDSVVLQVENLKRLSSQN